MRETNSSIGRALDFGLEVIGSIPILVLFIFVLPNKPKGARDYEQTTMAF